MSTCPQLSHPVRVPGCGRRNVTRSSGRYPLPQTAKTPVQAFQSPSAVEGKICCSIGKMQAERPGGKCLKLYMALRKKGFLIAAGLMIAAHGQ